MENKGFLALIKALLSDNLPFSTDIYHLDGWIIHLVKEELIPDRAYRISQLPNKIGTTTETCMRPIGIFLCETNILCHYKDYDSKSAINIMENELNVQDKLINHLGKSMSVMLKETYASIVKYLCNNLFHNDQPIPSEWDIINNKTERYISKINVSYFRRLFANKTFSPDLPFQEALAASILDERNIVNIHPLDQADLVLFHYGSASEQADALIRLTQSAIQISNSLILSEIMGGWEIIKTAKEGKP